MNHKPLIQAISPSAPQNYNYQLNKQTKLNHTKYIIPSFEIVH